MKKMYIFSGPVRTGKTTNLMKWAASKTEIDGIFQPVVEEKRFIYHIKSRTLKQLETEEKENITSIGKYKFSNCTFDWSKEILGKCLSQNLEWIIIDEIGPLELDGRGLEPAISKIFSEMDNLTAEIICVVRKEILDKFIEHYGLIGKYKMFELSL
ncbi:MAG: hypothetical protein CVV24_04160 [Ignavibacteriae bacterium HGW-Ignavibacteriae-3]|nr:MAG: hypothetical protein CVV24_04160 [Ignavibacteriae bacterium HGW-Ignavibacteriae-3]